jgi:alpha-1,2-mannosyltransferase
MNQKRLSTMERAAVAVLALAVLVSGLYFARKSGANPEAYSNDFSVYYHAAREVIAGRDPYQHLLGDWTPYIYPPLLAELIVPLAFLPLPVAAYLWFLISAASIAAAAEMSASLANERGRAAPDQHVSESAAWRAALAACAVVLVLRFVLDTFNLGQVNAVVAALAVAHVYLYKRDRKVLSAVALVLAVSIKLTPALLLMYHIAKLRLKFAVACAALFVAVTAISFLPFGSHGPDAFQVFWSRTVKNEQGYDFAYSGNQSLRGAIARLASHANESTSTGEGESRKTGDPATLLISTVLLAFAVFAAVRARSELAAAAPFFCCLVLLSPLSWKAHYVILILPVAYLLCRAKAPGKARQLIAATLVAAFVLFNLTSPHVIGLAAAEWADAHSLVFVGALLILIATVVVRGEHEEVEYLAVGRRKGW